MKKRNIIPKISVIIRTYNTAHFVSQAIKSVLSQTVNSKVYEILVIDDGSTDNTEEVLAVFKKKIRLAKFKHMGNHIKVLNKGISKARGEYITILDSDDLLLEDTLERLYKAAKGGKDIGIVYGDYYERSQPKGPLKRISTKKNIFNSLAGGILIKKKLIIEAGYYDEKLFFPEYDLLIKLTEEKKTKVAYLPVPLYIYNRHSASVTAERKMARKGIEQLKQKYKKDFPIRKY